MARLGFTPEVKALLRSGKMALAGFASFDLRHTRARFWTGLGIYTFMGAKWTGMGDMAGMSEIEETTELRATGMEFSLTGVPSTLGGRSLVDYVEFHTKTGGEVEAWIALFDQTTRIMVPDAKQIFAGSIDAPVIRINGSTFGVTIAAEGPLAGMNGTPGQRLNHETQRGLFPGDMGFEFVSKIQKKPDNLA